VIHPATTSIAIDTAPITADPGADTKTRISEL
jgi:hypothetical protein